MTTLSKLYFKARTRVEFAAAASYNLGDRVVAERKGNEFPKYANGTITGIQGKAYIVTLDNNVGVETFAAGKLTLISRGTVKPAVPETAPAPAPTPAARTPRTRTPRQPKIDPAPEPVTPAPKTPRTRRAGPPVAPPVTEIPDNDTLIHDLPFNSSTRAVSTIDVNFADARDFMRKYLAAAKSDKIRILQEAGKPSSFANGRLPGLAHTFDYADGNYTAADVSAAKDFLRALVDVINASPDFNLKAHHKTGVYEFTRKQPEMVINIDLDAPMNPYDEFRGRVWVFSNQGNRFGGTSQQQTPIVQPPQAPTLPNTNGAPLDLTGVNNAFVRLKDVKLIKITKAIRDMDVNDGDGFMANMGYIMGAAQSRLRLPRYNDAPFNGKPAIRGTIPIDDNLNMAASMAWIMGELANTLKSSGEFNVDLSKGQIDRLFMAGVIKFAHKRAGFTLVLIYGVTPGQDCKWGILYQ